MDQKKINNEKLFFALAFILALVLRIFILAAIPLSEFEANWALQAFQISKGQAVAIGPQPAYVILTSMLFSVFTSNEFMARVLPALFGSAILYLPYVLREKLGKTVALVFAFALAFDPGLISLSRLAGGPMLALSFTVLAIAFFMNGKSILAGLMAGLALLSGPAFWFGAILLLMSLVVYVVIFKNEINIQKSESQKALFVTGIVFVLIATNLFRNPEGISAFGSSFSVFLTGFTSYNPLPFGRLIMALVFYQPIALLFMFATIIYFKSEQKGIAIISQLFLLLSFAFLLIYPSRQVGDLAWALIPIWLLASISLSKFFFSKSTNPKRMIIIQALVIFSLFALVWLSLVNLSSLRQPPLVTEVFNSIGQGQFGLLNQLDLTSKAYLARIATLLLIPLMTVLLTVLMGMWWNPADSWRAFVWGLLISLMIFMAGSAWNGNYQRKRQVNELWTPGSVAGYPELLLETVGDISEFSVGTRGDIEIVSLYDSESLAWTLRFMPNLSFTKELAYNELPSVVITSDLSSEPRLNSSYRGQSFVLTLNKSWQQQWLPSDFLNWLAFRNNTAIPEKVILWARTDLFPDHFDRIVGNQNEDVELLEEFP